ncbi:MAG: tRNA-binding protein [Patescibacteria group bacterium]
MSITWKDFENVGLRVGTVIRIEDFPEAQKSAYKLWVDFGPFGVKQSSAQITTLYRKADLLGAQLICATGFSPKQIGPFTSEVLTTGFVQPDGSVVLAKPERMLPNGTPLA